MRVLGPVVEPLVLTVLHPRHNGPLGRRVGLQLIGHQHPRRAALLFQQFAAQALCRLGIAPALHQHIEHEATAVDGPPEILLLTSDGQNDLIKVPFVAALESTPAQLVGELVAELQALLSHRHMADEDAARCRHLLDHPQGRGKRKYSQAAVAMTSAG